MCSVVAIVVVMYVKYMYSVLCFFCMVDCSDLMCGTGGSHLSQIFGSMKICLANH